MLLRFQIILLAVILAGCASAPQPQDMANTGEQVASAQPLDEAAAELLGAGDAFVEPPARPQLEELTVSFPRRRPVDHEERLCLAKAIYFEARGEGHDGMVAVSSVVLNRVNDPRFPNSVCDVVYDGGEQPPCQFSWWCDGKSDRPSNPKAWGQSIHLAHEILAIPPDDPTGGAVFYHADWIKAPWIRKREQTAQIGRHIFYR